MGIITWAMISPRILTGLFTNRMKLQGNRYFAVVALPQQYDRSLDDCCLYINQQGVCHLEAVVLQMLNEGFLVHLFTNSSKAGICNLNSAIVAKLLSPDDFDLFVIENICWGC